MRFRRLRTEAELISYRDLFLLTYHEQSKTDSAAGSGSATSDLPLSYLQSCRVVGVFDRDRKMIAGYALGTGQPLRLLSFVPESVRANLIVPFVCNWDDCCEVTCGWKRPDLSQLWMSFWFWPHALIGVLLSKKKILLGHNQSTRLDKFYTALWPATIYEGISSFGLHSRLFAYNRWRVFLCIFLFWVFETPRRFLRSLK